MLKPEASVGFGLAVATMVYGIYQNQLPSVTDIRLADTNDRDIQSAERAAAWTSAGIVAGVSLITQDPTVFIIGGSMVVMMSWLHRHADRVDPRTGLASLVGLGAGDGTSEADVTYTAQEAA